MKDQLPSYQDALNVSPSNPNELLLIRLQVWHFFDVGRSPILNRQFARSFRQSNLAHWTVREVHVTEPNDMASRDTFVPVQVDFQHKRFTDGDPRGRAQYHVRGLFRRIAPALVFRFFLGTGSKPLFMSLVPLNVPQDRRSKYEQLFAISQLKINVQQFLRPAQLDEIDAIAALLSTATDALSALSFIVDFFIMMHAEQTNQSQFTSIPTSAASLVFGLAELFNSIQRIAPMVNELQQSYERSMILAAVDEPERLNAWQQAADPFLQHQTKFSRIATTLQRIKRGEAVTPQVLYTTALDLHASSLEFTRVRSRLNPQLVTELETYKGMEKWPKNFTGAGIVSAGAGAILLGCIASNPLGWAVATAFLGLGTLSTGTGGYQWMKVSNKRKAIRKVQQDLRDLASVFNEVRHDIAAFMCRTVLGIELDHLGDAEKRTFLESFAVDVDALHYQGYRESLVTSGIDKVLKYYDDLTTDFRQMVRHCGLDIDITETDQR
ncbi:hypothetical protein FPOAC2_04053 [Fusarium poae]